MADRVRAAGHSEFALGVTREEGDPGAAENRARERTLTDEEVNAAHARFQQAILAHFHATLRT